MCFGGGFKVKSRETQIIVKSFSETVTKFHLVNILLVVKEP